MSKEKSSAIDSKGPPVIIAAVLLIIGIAVMIFGAFSLISAVMEEFSLGGLAEGIIIISIGIGIIVIGGVVMFSGFLEKLLSRGR